MSEIWLTSETDILNNVEVSEIDEIVLVVLRFHQKRSNETMQWEYGCSVVVHDVMEVSIENLIGVNRQTEK